MYTFYEKKSYDLTFNSGTKLEISAHLHGHLELVYMLDGKCDTVVDGVKDTLCGGDVFITFPNQVHQFRRIGPENYLIFIFSPDFLPDIKDIFLNYIPTTAIVKNASSNEKLLALLQAVVDSSEKPSPYKEIIMKGHLLAFFGELIPMMSLLPVKTSSFSVLRNILNYCSENYKRELSLDVLSKDLHISKCYISHIFNDKLYLSFNEFINGLRVSEACRYLTEEKYNVTEVAMMVGFNTPRTFNRAFIKQMGMTPREYRASKNKLH